MQHNIIGVVVVVVVIVGFRFGSAAFELLAELILFAGRSRAEGRCRHRRGFRGFARSLARRRHGDRYHSVHWRRFG